MAKFGDFILKAGFAFYVIIALFVGVAKHREDGTPSYGTIVTIIEGAAWPITLLIDAVQRK